MAKAGKEGQAASYSLVIAKALRHVVCDPLVVSTLIGLVLAALQVNLPKWVSQSLTVIGSAGIAVPLVAVGMTIGGSKLKHSEGEVAWVSVVRLVVSPLLAIVACTGLGLLNGLVHVVLRIPSFMATLGLWFVGLGIGTVALGGSAVRVLDHGIRSIAFQRVLAFPLTVWIAAAMFLLALFLERRTRFGRYIYAIGGGEDIATLSGVPVKRTRILAFTLAGFFTGVAAVLAAAQLGQANTTIADGRLFMTVTAVVVPRSATS